jgi:DNA processing protein
MNEKLYWLGFSVFPGVGPGRFAKLLAAFGSAENAWNATEKELIEIIKPALTAEFLDFRKKFSIEEYEEKMLKAKVGYLTLNDSDYPQLLKEIKNPPFVLLVKGNKKILKPFGLAQGGQVQDDIYIGIVGTRKITDYGRQVTEFLTRELVDTGCVIVSGLAMGVDAVAHKTTIDSNGKTIAVLGCGVDCCYPRENQKLYEGILDGGGAIVSEYPIGQLPTIGSFPSRNRIIAGLSHGVVVTEGAADSGALITAKDALDAGRKVFAVPGPVTSSLSKGPYALIKQGAVVVSSAKEILEELGLKGNNPPTLKLRRAKGDSEEEQEILDLLKEQDLHFDELVKRTKIDSSELGTMLSMMEMKGMIKSLSAGFFSLVLEM